MRMLDAAEKRDRKPKDESQAEEELADFDQIALRPLSSGRRPKALARRIRQNVSVRRVPPTTMRAT